jgi:hypothetical protein
MSAGVAGRAAVCAVLALLCFAVPARAADPFFGLFTTNLNARAQQVGRAMDAQARTGAGLLREHVYWAEIERRPGVFDFKRLDALVARAAARGLTVLPILTGTPQFYSARPLGFDTDGWPPRDPSRIFAIAYELAKRYGMRGSAWDCLVPAVLCRRPYHPITAWQIWNEPDLEAWWRSGPDPAGYLRLLRWAYLGMKLAEPATEVVAAGMSIRSLAPGGYLDRLYALGAARWFDTLAVHPYAVGVGAVVAHVRRTRAIAAAHGDADVPLRVTEYGYATRGRSAWVAGPRCQAALIAATTRELSARRAAFGLRSIIELQWQDRRADGSGPWPDHAGLRYADGSPKPALGAFRRAVRGRPGRARSDVGRVCPARYRG